MDAGPDVQPMTDEDAARAEDFSVNDASGEGGPLDDVYFEYDQARLSDEARAILEKHALWLQNHRAAKIAVEGHCDERGTIDYNLALGEQRARATRDYLVNLGVAGDRLTTVSYGKERPLDPREQRGGVGEEPPRPLPWSARSGGSAGGGPAAARQGRYHVRWRGGASAEVTVSRKCDGWRRY